jgi:protein-S-isoprenylcysteine O-methyltransferase Ste14
MNEETKAETCGVPFPPPLVFGATLALGLALGRNAELDPHNAAYSRTAGTISLLAGAAVGAAAVLGIKRAGSAVNVYRPTTALVTTGAFRFSRNPVYFGLTAAYLGIALRARSIPALALLPIALALTDRLVVDPEERYLERRFGDEYRAYRDAVPRWF